MLIDTHCHLDFKDFDRDRDEAIRRSRDAGIGYIVNVGSSVEGTLRSIEIAEKNDFIFAAAGIHPHEADGIKNEDLDAFAGLLDRPKVVAVGEIGLDYYRDISSRENQRKMFIRLLGEARGKDLPLVIHNRDANDDILDILKDNFGGKVRGVMHCFSGDRVFLDKCLDLGMHISFTCNITFKNAAALRDVVRLVPMERLLLETDAPFLAPQVFRGKRNEPVYVRHLAEAIARIKNLSFDEIADTTTHNARALFKF